MPVYYRRKIKDSGRKEKNFQRRVYAVFSLSWIFKVPEKSSYFGYNKGASHKDQIFSFTVEVLHFVKLRQIKCLHFLFLINLP